MKDNLSRFQKSDHLIIFRLLTMCTRHFGSVVTQTIRTYKTDQFPLLLIVMGKRTSNEVLNVIQGKDDCVNETSDRINGVLRND